MLEVSLSTHIAQFQLSMAFTAPPGTTTVLLGESGAGKTTVLRLLAGLLQADQGYIRLGDQTYFERQGDRSRAIMLPPQERSIGYVFQDYVLFPHLSVFENVAFGLRAQHLPRATVSARVQESLAMLGLTQLGQRRPAQLSGGQQQRVAIARALVLRPQLLLLDEPLAALDVQTRREVRQELRQLLAELHITTVLVTHQFTEALLFGQQILVLDHGRVIQQGNQQQLRTAPRSAYIAELVGVNFFEGHLLSQESGATAIVQLPGDSTQAGPELVVTLREHNALAPVASNQPAYVIVDPRSVTLHTTQPEGSARNVLQGEILHLLPLETSTPSLVGESANEMGRVRVSIRLDHTAITSPLSADITPASVTRLQLYEGRQVYATFKATEAWGYV